MQVAIACRHGSIPDTVHQYITEKSEKIVSLFERITAIQVTVEFVDQRAESVRVEILVDSEHKHDFVAHDEGDAVIATFDRALHKMEQQIRKYKEKVQNHNRGRPDAE
ncbi:MAG: ribosome hibernation-promoting factor, HPF/YfiA family [Planctomycetaceae bacterium]